MPIVNWQDHSRDPTLHKNTLFIGADEGLPPTKSRRRQAPPLRITEKIKEKQHYGTASMSGMTQK